MIKIGTKRADVITGSQRGDLIVGLKGDDVIDAGKGNDIIDGGKGVDTALFSGNFAGYEIDVIGAGSLLTTVRGADGFDLLRRVEFFRFDDGVFNVETGQFLPDAPPPPPTVSIGDAIVSEDGAFATFTITLSAPSPGGVTVSYATQDGAALAGEDYAASFGQVAFAAGETTKTVTVAINDDGVFEPNQSFSVALTSATGATIADGVGEGAIVDDEPLPTLSINDVTVTENLAYFGYAGNPLNGGTTANPFGGFYNIDFTVTLSGPSSVPVTVAYTTPTGFVTDPSIATPNQDFIVTNGTITFLPGETSKTIRVIGADDFQSEPVQNFSVTLSGATNATILDDVGFATILDDDVPAPLPTLSINDVTATETRAVIAGGTGYEGYSGVPFNGVTLANPFGFYFDMFFTVSLSAASAQDVSFNFSTNPGSGLIAENGIINTNGTITIPAGQTSATIRVVGVDDFNNTGNDQFPITISNAVGATILDGFGQGTIIEDDVGGPPPPPPPPPGDLSTVNVASLGPVLEESGAPMAFSFTRAGGDLSQSLTVNYVMNTAPAGGVATEDFAMPVSLFTPTSITFAANQSSVQLDLAVFDDSLAEGDEALQLLLMPSFAYIQGPAMSASGLIQASDFVI